MSSNAPCAAAADAPSQPAFSTALRALKNRLQTRFPEGKSSHLTEAIAAGLGFSSQAALRARLAESAAMTLPPFNAMQFVKRLDALGYEARSHFVQAAPPPLERPDTAFADLQAALRVLRTARSKNSTSSNLEWGRYLHRRCAHAFGDAHDLGQPADRTAGKATRRWHSGADHSACLPGWGAMLHGRFLRFGPGVSQLHFLRPLPLAGGGFVHYTSAVVDMPTAQDDSEALLAAAELRAGVLGWTSTRLPQWNWRWPRGCTLVLYRPSISHSERLCQWEASFQRWLLENQRHLLKGATTAQRQVIKELIACPHLPLHARNFEDFRNVYLKEQKPLFLHPRPDGFNDICQQLFEMWRGHCH